MAPFILKAKQIFQDLCKIKCGWDDAIAETYLTPWKDWLAKLEQLSKVQINRCMKPKNFGKVKQAQMHHFCDASEHGYDSVSYLRLTNKAGEIHVALVLGKSRVTPLKQITIPRLELASATLAARMDRLLRSELRTQNSASWTQSWTRIS